MRRTDDPRTHVGDLSAVASYWRPSVEELAVLNAGGSIALWVLGATDATRQFEHRKCVRHYI